MIKGTMCCDCKVKEATHYWHGGQALCIMCLELWKKRDENFRKEFRKEVIGEKLVNNQKIEKKTGQTKLF